MPTVITNDVPGTYSWTALSTTVTVECYGGGADGDSAPSSGGVAFGGGGGGGYGLKVITGLTIGTSYSYHVAGPDEDSWFINTSTVAGLAGGLSPGLTISATEGEGGPGGGWVGDSGANGNRGGDGVDDDPGPFGSGGGGNGGGPLGGAGGASVGSGFDGNSGSPYGGGGSGAGGDVATVGGVGASGMVRLTFTTAAGPILQGRVITPGRILGGSAMT
jgi:hypothetical protein